MRTKRVSVFGLVCIIAFVMVAYGAITMNTETPKSTEIRKSSFYRGAVIIPRHSKSYARLPEDSVVLESVLQGDIAEHDFIIPNSSNDPITIKNTKSCCGFIITSFSPEILPGKEGKISVTVPTDKLGGKTIQGEIQAELNHTVYSKISIRASLFVKKFADISQHKLILSGRHNQKLEKTTRIIPEKIYPFKIHGIKAKKGLHINYTYQEVETQAGKEYIINVLNTKKKPGVYRDTLFIQTDHPRRPEIRIRVEGHITESD